MTECDPGTIVLVHFPFTDLSSTKKRPAIVVSPRSYGRRAGDVVVLALTSQDQKDSSLQLTQWRAAGLPKATWVKPVIGTISLSLVQRDLGKLHSDDHKCVKAAFGMLLKIDWP